MPAVINMMLLKFFSKNDFNFKTTGLRFPTEADPSADLRAGFGFFVEDEKACKMGFDVKGASGCKMCIFCKCVCATHLKPGPDFVVHTEPDRTLWDEITHEEFKELIQEVDAVKEDSADLKEVETNAGINYNPHGPLWDPYLVDLMNAPFCHYWDAMHCLYASGGVAQFQVNGFINAVLNQSSFELEDFDSFAASIKGHRLQRSFFQSRVVKKDDAHIKCFALECVDTTVQTNTDYIYLVWKNLYQSMTRHFQTNHTLGLQMGA